MEEQQGEIKNILQYPKEEMYETIRGHVDLFICLFERLIEIEHSVWDFYTPYLLVT
jgi:hypothetical protein